MTSCLPPTFRFYVFVCLFICCCFFQISTSALQRGDGTGTTATRTRCVSTPSAPTSASATTATTVSTRTPVQVRVSSLRGPSRGLFPFSSHRYFLALSLLSALSPLLHLSAKTTEDETYFLLESLNVERKTPPYHTHTLTHKIFFFY